MNIASDFKDYEEIKINSIDYVLIHEGFNSFNKDKSVLKNRWQKLCQNDTFYHILSQYYLFWTKNYHFSIILNLKFGLGKPFFCCLIQNIWICYKYICYGKNIIRWILAYDN